MSEQIYASEPFCSVLSPNELEWRCSTCYVKKAPLSLKKCGVCKVMRYCNSACQRKDWRLHKGECPALKACSPRIPTEYVLFLNRLLIRCKNGDDVKIVEELRGKSRCFADLMSHKEEIENDPIRMEQFLTILHALKMFNPELVFPFEDELLEIFGKSRTNSFTIEGEDMQPIGIGLVLIPSLFDHSCDPNAFVLRDGNISRIITASTAPVTEIFISYMDQLCDRAERRAELKELYHFHCECSRCLDDVIESEMLSTICPSVGCTNIVLSKQDSDFEACTLCGFDKFDKQYANRKQAQIDSCKETVAKAKELVKEQDHSELKKICNKCLKKADMLHPLNIHRVKVQGFLMNACLHLSNWTEAFCVAEQMLPAYRKYYNGKHPSLGTHLMMLGKLALYINRLRRGLKYLREAEGILSTTHAKDHPLFENVIYFLEQTKAGLSGQPRICGVLE